MTKTEARIRKATGMMAVFRDEVLFSFADLIDKYGLTVSDVKFEGFPNSEWGFKTDYSLHIHATLHMEREQAVEILYKDGWHNLRHEEKNPFIINDKTGEKLVIFYAYPYKLEYRHPNCDRWVTKLQDVFDTKSRENDEHEIHER